jgi:hydroxymethylpyrimidine kinase/phosphomethylpyrimidine kinase
MLGSATTISVVAEALQKHKISISVIDPVMVATTGAQLLPEQAVKTLCQDLLPRTYLLTPNIPEANLILKEAGCEAVKVQDLNGLKELASAVRQLGPKHVLIKGGHIPLNSSYKVAASNEEKSIVVNILAGDDVFEVIESPFQKSRNTHGTGCSLACMSAINREFSTSKLTVRSCNCLQPCQRPRHLIGSASSMSLRRRWYKNQQRSRQRIWPTQSLSLDADTTIRSVG